MTKLIGYHDNIEISSLTSIFPRMTVLIPKGTRVYSQHKGEYVTKRDQKVKVHHVKNGCNLPLTDRHCQDQIEEYFKRDGAHCILSVVNNHILPRGINASVPVKNPTVSWAGSGGYWCEADVNDVVVIK